MLKLKTHIPALLIGCILGSLLFIEYLTAAIETLYPAQWGGNTYWRGSNQQITVDGQQRKTIALTFDDGPSRYTPQILDILKQHRIPATFFMMGRQVEAHPGIAKRVLAEGHEIGNHGYNLIAQKGIDKLYLPSLNEQELHRSQQIIEQVTGYSPIYYRPPGGQMGRNLWRQVASLNLTTITGTLPFPEASDSAEQQLKLIAENLEPGGILILHDGNDAQPNSGRGQNVVELMPLLLAHLTREGYQVVGLSKIK